MRSPGGPQTALDDASVFPAHVEPIATRDGARILATRWGRPRPNRAPIVLLHPLAADRRFWRPVAERLAGMGEGLAIDCRGHGGSDKPPGPYTVELFAHDLAAALDHVGWPAAAIVGTSMGGCVALAFADAYPERVAALGLIDTTAWYGEDAPKVWAERADRALAAGLQDLVAFQQRRWFTDAFRASRPEIVARTVETFLGNDVAAYAESCRMLGACDLRAALPRVKVPTKIIVGREDYATPVAMAEALHRGIAASRLVVIEEGRHLTPVEQPERIAVELASFIWSADRSATAFEAAP